MAVSTTIKIHVSEKIYLRDPEETQLGRKILNHSIHLIHDLGFEAYTFKKVAVNINSTEASVYRYFESKHHLLVYLISWYWAWQEYQIDYQTNNIENPEKKLRIIIKIIAEASKKESSFSYIDESALHRIVVSEASKSYYTKNVDSENQDGFFRSYKSLCRKIAEIMLQFNAGYPYPFALSSTILESAHQQVFFSQHLPSLTEVKLKENDYQPIINYLEHLVFTQLKS